MPPTEHVELGGSSCSRWIACPGSVRLSRQVPETSGTSSEHARLGTTAHKVAEMCLTAEVNALQFLDQTVEGMLVDEEMCDAVQVYVDYVRSRQGRKVYEQHFVLQDAPAPMSGTADCVIIGELGIEVVDFKYGKGVHVGAEGNDQLSYYALGAVESLIFKPGPALAVTLTVVQPRAGGIKSWTTTKEYLDVFRTELMHAAAETLKENAPLNPGTHCRWCRALPICPAVKQHALVVAQSDFDVVPAEVPPAPETIPIEQFGQMLDKLPILEDWIKGMWNYARSRLESGQDVPGFKLVARRATRKWKDEQAAIDYVDALGYKHFQYMEDPVLKSPAQLEKILPKEKREGLGHFVAKVSTGYNVVPEDDPRPAITLTQGEEFDLLPTGETK